MKILVTGGAGYVGSHCALELMEAGHDVVIVDNLSNSKAGVVDRIAELAGRRPEFVRLDVRDEEAVGAVLAGSDFDAVMHFAGLKAVGESTERPLRYYDHNVGGAIALLKAMRSHGPKTLVFSSSATVYGEPGESPIPETAPRSAHSPYGRSKLIIESMLEDLAASDPTWSVVLLRYFNPVGAHPSGRMGEDPLGVPNNLAPFIAQVAVGRLDRLRVFGDDYPTPDGTGVRDYIHVVDLALGHLAALDAHVGTPGAHIYNLGCGRGASVLELHAAFEAACGRPIPYEVVDRRPGDVTACWADPSRARRRLGWATARGLQEIAADTWRWQQANPTGYPDEGEGAGP